MPSDPSSPSIEYQWMVFLHSLPSLLLVLNRSSRPEAWVLGNYVVIDSKAVGKSSFMSLTRRPFLSPFFFLFYSSSVRVSRQLVANTL